MKNDLMDGIVTDWKRLPGGEAIETTINSIIGNYNITQPDLSVPSLVKLYQAIKALPEGNWRNKKLDEVEQIIIECSALYIEATSSQQQVVQGDSLNINFVFNERTNVNASLKKISIENFDSSFTTVLPANQNVSINKILAVADDKKISQPYWLEYPLKGGTFDVRDQTLIGKAQNDPSFEASFLVNINGEDFTIKRPVQYRFIDPVKGDTYEPIPVLPKVELRYDKENYISIDNKPVTTNLLIRSNLGNDYIIG